jgi:hypothetical protein
MNYDAIAQEMTEAVRFGPERIKDIIERHCTASPEAGILKATERQMLELQATLKSVVRGVEVLTYNWTDNLKQQLGPPAVPPTRQSGYVQNETTIHVAKLLTRLMESMHQIRRTAVANAIADVRYDPPPPDLPLDEQVRHARGFAAGICRDDHHVSRLLEQMARSIEALAGLPVQQPTAAESQRAW